MTQHPELFAALGAPFDQSELKLRTQAGRQMPYVTARTIMNRLDEVLGPENWWDDFVPLEHSVICRLTIRLPDGTVLTKCDAGGYAGLADPGDDDKSGFADAFKRTAVKFGVGRYLYRDGVPNFGRVDMKKPSGVTRESTEVVEHGRVAPSAAAPPPAAASPPGEEPVATAAAPRTGKALFAWTRDQDHKFEYGLLRYLSAWARNLDFPPRMVDWDSEQVALAFGEASRRVRSLQTTDQAPGQTH